MAFKNYNLKKRILLSGAAGAIGLETLKELVKRKDNYEIVVLAKDNKKHRKKLKKFDADIHTIYGDIRHSATIEQLTNNIDFVIHLAAIIPPRAEKNPKLAEEVNLDATVNLIKSLEKNSPNAFFVFASSVAIYGDRLENPIISVTDEINKDIDDNYSKAKIKCEEFLKTSSLSWSIFRLTAIMHPRQKFDPLMFHMPLETKMEICTSRDTALALVNAIEKKELLNKQIFNLSGGKKCRVIYGDFLKNSFINSGLGEHPFPNYAFAKANFHCGYYSDSDKLNHLLNFRRDTIEDYYRDFKSELGKTKIILAKIFRPCIIRYFLAKSDPLKARKSKDQKMIQYFFPKEKPMLK
jgi:nucleoside-diphosphate-sugar epimerase